MNNNSSSSSNNNNDSWWKNLFESKTLLSVTGAAVICGVGYYLYSSFSSSSSSSSSYSTSTKKSQGRQPTQPHSDIANDEDLQLDLRTAIDLFMRRKALGGLQQDQVVFDKADTNRDGVVELKELKDYMAQIAAEFSAFSQQHIAPTVDVEGIFEQFDHDHNGVLDRKEFSEFCYKFLFHLFDHNNTKLKINIYRAIDMYLSSTTHGLNQVDEIFDRADKDRSNTVELSELKSYLVELSKGFATFAKVAWSEDDVERAFTEFDQDHNGKLDRQEFHQFCTQWLRKICA